MQPGTMSGTQRPGGEDDAARLDWRFHARRLQVLALLFVVAYAAAGHFIAIAENPRYDIHSDDVLIIRRFVLPPRAVMPKDNAPLAQIGKPHWGVGPVENWEYVYSLDHPALQRWIFHYLLKWTGRMPRSLPDAEWDYDKDFKWNVDQGHVAPAETRRFVRVVNNIFMVIAAVFLYVALARAVSPMAALLGALYFIGHTATVEIGWSLGQDPLLWMLVMSALVLWVYLGASRAAAISVGIVAGLAASTKLNGVFFVIAFCLWLVLKKKWRLALLSGGIAFGVFIVLDPVLFSRGIFRVPQVLWEMVAWRSWRAALYAQHFPAFAQSPRWRVIVYLLAYRDFPWPLLLLLVVARRLRRLEAVPFWGLSFAACHLLTVTAPVPRYIFPVQVPLVIGVIAAWWPRRLHIGRGWLARVKATLAVLGKRGPKPPE